MKDTKNYYYAEDGSRTSKLTFLRKEYYSRGFTHGMILGISIMIVISIIIKTNVELTSTK